MILREIQMNIRSNFGKLVNWDDIPKGNFNCYMFAISNTIPTEVFDYEKDGEIYLKSCIGANVPYFGNIGQISGKSNYTNVTELINALKCDLETLGISVESCSLETVVPKQCVKIAFYYNTEDLLKGKHSGFHFLRQDNNIWEHKKGWTGTVEQLESFDGDTTIAGLDLIGYFQLAE